jgi:undecaprenyl-phosphate galactose phosphotransferase
MSSYSPGAHEQRAAKPCGGAPSPSVLRQTLLITCMAPCPRTAAMRMKTGIMKPIESIFLRKRQWYQAKQAEKWLLVLVDILAMLTAFICAAIVSGLIRLRDYGSHLRFWSDASTVAQFQSFLVIALLAIIAFESKGNYSKRKPYSNEIRDLLTVTCTLAVINAAIFFLGKFQFSRANFLLTWCMVLPALLIFRATSKYILAACGGWIRPIVIIGWGQNAYQTALAFDGEPLMGFRIQAFLVPEGKPKPDFTFHDRHGHAVPCIAMGRDFAKTLNYLGEPHVVLALEQDGLDQYPDMVQQLGRASHHLQIVPAVRGLPLHGMEANHFFAHEVLLLTVRNNLARRLPQLVKRAFDLFVSITALIIGLPVLLWISLRVMQSGFPIFYGHSRIGQGSKTFNCYKFRTMAPNADALLKELLERDPEAKAEWARDFKLKEDPRITPIGKFLRRTSLDELPQLWNVLKGDMSLVGPRPVVDAELERYGNQVDYYLEAKPGITGLWQISGRNDVTYETRVYLDAWYVKNWSLYNDIVILLRTVKVVLGSKNGAY